MDEDCQTREWINKARQGDSLAASKLLATYHPLLRARVEARMDETLHARSEPEDILQQVYLDVFRRIDRFEDRGPNSFLNWVLTILDNKLIDVQRALHRQMRDVVREISPPGNNANESYWNLFEQLYVDSTTPSRVIRRDEAVGALLTCISRLSDLHRQVIQLRFLEGGSVSEVAHKLHKSEAAVVALAKRALEALREGMGSLGEFTRVP